MLRLRRCAHKRFEEMGQKAVMSDATIDILCSVLILCDSLANVFSCRTPNSTLTIFFLFLFGVHFHPLQEMLGSRALVNQDVRQVHKFLWSPAAHYTKCPTVASFSKHF